MNTIGVDVRKLVALDMAFHGRRFIVLEFAAGVVICSAFGLLNAAVGVRLLNRGVSWQLLLGIALLWVALNYVPLLIHAIDLARRGFAREEEVTGELADMRLVRSYSWRQLWILVPFAIVMLDVRQRLARSTQARLTTRFSRCYKRIFGGGPDVIAPLSHGCLAEGWQTDLAALE